MRCKSRSRGNYGLVFRVYNDGAAYRFTTKRKEPIVIADEEAVYNFPSDYKTFTAYVNSTKPTFEEQFFNSFEQPYVNETITSLNDKRLKILPLWWIWEMVARSVSRKPIWRIFPGCS